MTDPHIAPTKSPYRPAVTVILTGAGGLVLAALLDQFVARDSFTSSVFVASLALVSFGTLALVFRLLSDFAPFWVQVISGVLATLLASRLGLTAIDASFLTPLQQGQDSLGNALTSLETMIAISDVSRRHEAGCDLRSVVARLATIEGRVGATCATSQQELGVHQENVHVSTGPLQDVLFPFGEAALLDAENSSRMEANIEWLREHQDQLVVLHGHADARGDEEFNGWLAFGRALTVRNALVAGGVAAQRIKVASHGNLHPVCEESAESCFRRNRRVSLVVSPALPRATSQPGDIASLAAGPCSAQKDPSRNPWGCS